VTGLADALVSIVESPARHGEMRVRAAAWAQRFSLEELRDELRVLFEREWKLAPGQLGVRPEVVDG
jgi:hypothetical protein